MLEVILDTETTGLSTASNHKIVEIGCVELNNQIPTNKTFHTYLNPQRAVSEDAFKIHGYSDQFIVEYEIFLQCAQLAGLNKISKYSKVFPNEELATISLNIFR